MSTNSEGTPEIEQDWHVWTPYHEEVERVGLRAVAAAAYDEGTKYAANFVAENAETVTDFVDARRRTVEVLGWLMQNVTAPNPYGAAPENALIVAPLDEN